MRWYTGIHDMRATSGLFTLIIGINNPDPPIGRPQMPARPFGWEVRLSTDLGAAVVLRSGGAWSREGAMNETENALGDLLKGVISDLLTGREFVNSQGHVIR